MGIFTSLEEAASVTAVFEKLEIARFWVQAGYESQANFVIIKRGPTFTGITKLTCLYEFVYQFDLCLKHTNV
jgi:hypothetical protein